ncbi:MAG: Type IV pilus biogenesis protein PilM [Candidatus Woesebacteria bacterium GW2011_GWB1_43_14]|uniref:Type IV pilus biogenesis protein PilM n=1 Tax=Candidatus Woesebacteria bacterium GW2011_GWB1_43_14 TaxID=1618578 RepID=A0A0G1FPT8_9BACT|nr:MAG: type IV pilus assembly protein PilM, type IV pilus assembly protein PilM [Candidatus Woesebacteria bacterium GW2011_GWC1_42_9]KKS97046.1 MAG: Type IV pilus biogenesis protein PilM [Candidatus Woesebacteria bacterium GW2011_GWB1_43_14]
MSIGLDIGSKTIKVVELSFDGDKATLKAAGAVGYKGINIPEVEDKKSFVDLATAIKKLFSEAKVSSKNVSVSLPESQVYTRVLKFPLLTDQEVASAVKWEAEEYIPIPLKDAVIEHQILERVETSTPPQVIVLLIAVPRKLVEKYVSICTMAGLECVGVETELMSAVRCIAPPGKTVVIVDFGAKSTDIAIAKNGELFLSRSIPTAGDALTRSVAQTLGVSGPQAEEYKRAYGLASGQLEGKVSRTLAPVVESIAEEIKKAIQYYQMDLKGESPTSVFLTGGSAGLPDIAPLFTKLLGSEVVIASAFSRVSVDDKSSKSLANFAPLYPIAVGLALRKD